MNKNAIKYGFYSVLGFIAVGAFALGIGNFPKVPFIDDKADVVAKPAVTSGDTGQASGDATKPDEPAKSQDKVEVAPPHPAPTFNTLRVEKSGSILVAGNAKPNSKVSLLKQDGTVIGESTALANGDFVVTPDVDLPPGDYSLSLRAVAPDGTEMVSASTGIVRVPEQGQDDTLAMVSKDGEASKIFVKPGGEAKPETVEIKPEGDEATAKDDAAGEEVKTSETDSAEKPAENESASKTEDVAALDPKQDESAVEPAKTEPASPAADDVKEDATPAADENKEVVSTEENEPAVDPAEKPKPAPVDKVAVEAVEVENGSIYVAGAVQSGKRVRIYMDNQVLGDATGTADNRFLLERRFALSNGTHAVRADVVDPLTGKVTGRAEVPLLHEVKVAEIAPEPTPAVETPKVDEPKIAEPEVEQPKTDETKVAETPAPKPSKIQRDGDGFIIMAENRPNVPKIRFDDAGNILSSVAQPGMPEMKLKRVKDAIVTVAETGSPSIVIGRINQQGQLIANAIELPAKAVKEEQVAKVEDAPAKPEDEAEDAPAAEPAVKVDETGGENTTANEQQPQKETDEAPAVSPSVDAPDAQDTQVEQPKVAEVTKPETADKPEPIRTGTSIIIKRGDNLWTISRKTYGRGIHYTTIYKANEEQIRNPHRIYIGQIFKIPDEADKEQSVTQ